jgi:hypothetical protein
MWTRVAALHLLQGQVVTRAYHKSQDELVITFSNSTYFVVRAHDLGGELALTYVQDSEDMELKVEIGIATRKDLNRERLANLERVLGNLKRLYENTCREFEELKRLTESEVA